MLYYIGSAQFDSRYLEHFGIKGQRWGIRRYQNEDGSLTEEGKRHYGYKQSVSDAKKEYRKMIKNGADVDYAKSIYSTKIAKAHIQYKKQSKSMQKYVKEFTDQGMTKEEAEIAAYKKDKIKKIVAITAGITVAAASAYAIHKYRQYANDIVIKAGNELQRITPTPEALSQHPEWAYFAAYERADKKRYSGMLGMHFAMRSSDPPKVVGMRLGSDARIASPRNAQKIMDELMRSNPTFASQVRGTLQERSPKRLYERFNQYLAGGGQMGGPGFESAVQTFYKRVKDAGYNGIIDINDRKFSGYEAKNPVIMLGGQKIVDRITTRDYKNPGLGGFLGESLKAAVHRKAPKVAAVGAGLAAYKIANTAKRNKSDREFIARYRKEHPNTNLSTEDIIKLKYSRKR